MLFTKGKPSIRMIRAALNLTQIQLAAMSGIDVGTVKRAERLESIRYRSAYKMLCILEPLLYTHGLLALETRLCVEDLDILLCE